MTVYPVLILTGPTCAGKTRLAVNIARHTGAIVLPLDQLQRYAYLKEGVGLDLSLLSTVPHDGYQALSPWQVSGPAAYVGWLKSALEAHAGERPVVIEGCCTSYLQKILESVRTGVLLRPLRVLVLDSDPRDHANLERVQRRCSIAAVDRIVDETAMLVDRAFISPGCRELFEQCERWFVHPEHDDRRLAWAIRIAARVYFPAYLALQNEISRREARERLLRNALEIQVHQRDRLSRFLADTDAAIYQVEEAERLKERAVGLLVGSEAM